MSDKKKGVKYMFRPEIQVLDCTIRDGGLMNDSKFSLETVQNIYRALCSSGVDVIEIGYKNSKKMFSPDEFGPWRFCEEEMLKKATDGIETDSKLAVMMDAHKSFADQIEPKEKSLIDMIRVATYVKDVDKAIAIANAASELGYEACINIMAISHTIERELDEALQQIEEETKIVTCNIVDSFGSLYSEDVDYYIKKFRNFLKTKEVGVHCHNQQQLAYANTIEAIIQGVNYLDGTLYGLGRAAGNCPLELLFGFLKNPKFDIRPLLDIIGKEIIPMQETMKWGYTIPYMVSGILNQHPTEALELMHLPEGDKTKYDYAAFYERQSEEEF
jgi:4-hydroxy 2-oxovalerate aldolase